MTLGRSALARNTLAAVAATAALAILGFAAGCSSERTNDKGAVGSAELNLSLPDNTTIDTVGYSVTHSNGYSNMGTVPVTNSAEVKFQIGNIPARAGYSISLTATTSGNVTCSAGPVPFDISAGQTALIMMTLHCGGGTSATSNGNVRVDVDVQTDASCAQVDGLTVLPRSVIVGNTVALRGYATTAVASYGWSVAPASAGSFSPDNAAATTFSCTQVGTHTVTLRVSGGGSCTASTADVPVICTPSGAAGSGAAGSGSAGTSAAGTGAAGTPAAGSGAAGTGTAGTGSAGTIAAGNGAAGTGAAGTTAAGTGAAGVVAAGSGAAGSGAAGTGAAGTAAAGSGAAGTGVAGTGAAGTGAAGTGAAGTGGGSYPSAACTTCRNTACRNYQGSGLDLVAGCFEAINTDYGATAGDPTFFQNCIDVLNCAHTNNCAYGANGASDCYCGSATPDACIQTGPSADAKCVPQFQAATRATSNTDITGRVSDLAYPMGWAFFLLECDRNNCATQCAL